MSLGTGLQLEDVSQLLHTGPMSAGRDWPAACRLCGLHPERIGCRPSDL